MRTSLKRVPNAFRLILLFTMAISQIGSLFLFAPTLAQAATLYGRAIPVVPATYSSSIVGIRTGVAGVCISGVNCSVTNTSNVVNATTTDAGNMTILAAIIGTVRLSVAAGQTIPAGYKAGFRVNTGSGLINLSLLGSVHIKTYLAGALREDISDPALLTVSLFGGSSDSNISVVTTMPFDEIQLEVTTLIGAGLNWSVYYALVQQPFNVTTGPGGILSEMLWLKGDAGTNTTTDGGSVTAWSDQSINNSSAGTVAIACAGCSGAPTNGLYRDGSNVKGLNFNPTVEFAGGWLDGATGGMSTPEQYVVFVNPSAATGFERIVAHLGANGASTSVSNQSGPSINYTNGNTGGNYSAGTANNVIASNSGAQAAKNAPHVYRYNHISASAATTTIDGLTSATAPTVTGTAPAPFVDQPYRLGADLNGTNPCTGCLIAEVISFPASLTTTERQQVESYLAIKYGITLNQTTAQNYLAGDASVIWNATTNAAYNNTITAIGRDDLSLLNQKQSKSVTANGLVTIGLGTIAATNASNPNTFAADKSFEAFGDNNGAISSWVTLAGDTPASDVRITREWKVQETGTVGTVKISVPDNSSSATPKLPVEPPAGKVVLLVDSDGDFSNGATKVPMTLIGTNWQADVNFTAVTGYYFTIASDFTPSEIASITSTTTNGSYGIGVNVNVSVNLSEQVQTGSTLSLVLDTGATVILTCVTGPCSTLSGSYTVAAGQSSSDLTVASVTGSLTDMSGNVNTTLTLPVGQNLGDNSAIAIDTTTPDTTIGTKPALVTNSTNATFSFIGSDTLTLPANITFECSLDGAAFVACTNPKSYTSLVPGSHSFVVRAVDEAGNIDATPASYTWQIDTSAPLAPVISSPANGGITNQSTPLAAGTAEAGSTITVKDGTTLVCTATADASGNWTCTPTVALADGAHTLSVTATDPAGNISLTGTTSFTINTAAVSTPAVLVPAPGASTSDTTPAISGTADAGTTVVVTDNGNPVCTTTADASGNWTCTPTTALSEGPHTISVTATNPAGTASTAATQTFDIDTTAPTSAPTITSPAAGANVSSATPTFTGTGAEVGSTVTVLDGTTPICTTTADASGHWICTPTTALSEGAHSITATDTDAAGNTGPASTPQTVTVDTIAPTSAPTITSPPAGAVVTDTTPTFSGTGAEVGSTVTVLDGTTPVCIVVADASGNWTCTPTTALSEGPHAVSATATDAAGNVGPVSTSQTVTVDTTAPVTPVISSPANGAITNQTTPLVAGTAEAGSTIVVLDGTTLVCTATVDASGNWSCTPSTGLASGAHTLNVTATDAVGNISPAGTTAFTIDTAAVSTPAVLAPAPGGSTNDTTPTISGTADAGTTVVVTDNGTPVCTATADASGHWTCTPTTALSEGSHTISVTATNPAGTASTALTQTFTVDTTVPTSAPTITSPAAGASVNDATPTVSGTGAESGSTVTVLDGTTPICTATADASGNWSCTPSTILSEGLHTLTATATDAAGNTGQASTPQTVTVDTITPITPVISSPTPGASVNDTTPTFNGTGAEVGSTVTVLDGTTSVCTATVDTSGNWTCDPMTALSEGPHSITATATDPAGNVSSASSSQTVTVDTTAPTSAPTITSPAAGANVSSHTPAFSGTGAEVGSTVTVLDGTTPVCTVTADASGNWSCTPTTALSEGPHAITVTATDAADNTGPASSPQTVTVDTIPPVAPVISSPANNGIINQSSPLVAGTAEVGSTITVLDGTTPVCTVTADVSGHWSCTPSTPLASGVHTLNVTATDPAGNTSLASTTAFTIDTAAVSTPAVLAPAPGDSTSDTTPAISGTADAGTTVVVTDNGNPVCTATADSSGNWTCTPSTALSEGSHTISVTATNPAGTASTAASQTFDIDTTAPTSAPTITSPAAGATVSDATPTFSGTGAEVGSTVTVLDGTTPVCTATADASGNWSCTPSTPLGEGAHTLTVTATDAAGNTGPASASQTVTVDTVAPTSAPTITSPAAGATTNNDTPVFSGAGAEASSTVTVLDGTTPVCTATADASGNWSCTPTTPLGQGSHAISVTATDAAGNTGPASTPQAVTVDTVAPTNAPTITSPTAGTDLNDAMPLFTGTGAEAGSTVTVLDGPTPVCTATADASGNWSCTPSTALSEGPHILTATATDMAGNIGPASTPQTVTVDTVAPTSAPTISSPAAGVNLNDAMPPFSGTGAEAGSTVTVLDGTMPVCTATADASGNWTCTPTTSLSEGSHTLTATATDAAGNTGPASTPQTVTVDTVAPTNAPTITSPAAGASVSNTTPTFSGAGAEAGSTVTVLDGPTLICTATADASGNWSCTPSTALSEGPHTVTATATDATGNTGPASTPQTVTVDTIAPVAPLISSPANGGIINQTKPLVAGTAEPGSTIAVLDGTTPACTTTVDASGNWSCPAIAPLADGAHTLSVTATDDAGNISPAGTTAFTVDPLAVSTPAILTPTPSDTINTATPIISGTADAGTTLVVTDNGNPVCTATADASGNWTCTPSTALSEGAHTISVTATNPAGAASTAATQTFTVDTIAPSAAPTITNPAAGANVNDATPTFSGTGAEAGGTVTVLDGTTPVCTATADASGNWSCTPSTPLGEGAHTLSATATDVAGNTGPASTPQTVNVDTVVSPAPTITSPAAGAEVNDAMPTFAGTGAEPGSTVTVLDGTTPVCTATADASGNWTCTPTTPLGEGLHTLTTTATDAAGNTSLASSPQTVMVDTVAPTSAPTITSPAASANTNDATPIFTGTGAEPGSTVTVLDGLTPVCTATADASGNWSCTPSTPLSEGPHTLSATATDTAGNTGPASTPQTVTVDTTDPIVPTINSPASGGIINDTTPLIAGTAEPGTAIVVTDNGMPICTATADASANWSCTPATPLGNGSHTIGVTATDSAGNTSTAAVSTFTVDPSAVSTPAILSPSASATTNDSTPTISGVADPGATVTVTENGTPICTATADASGNWSCTPSTPLSEGTHTISATATNAAGMTSTPAVQTFGIDSTPPSAAPTITSPAAGASMNDTTPTFSGTGAEPGSTVTVLDGTTPICTATADASGNWTCTPITPLGEGAHTITTTVTDAAGNTGPISAPQTVTVDTTLPAAPVVTSPAPGGTTNDSTPTITGTAAPGSMVIVRDNGTPICTATADASGNWTCTPTAPLSEGSHTIMVTATDQAGNTSPAATRTFTIDLTAVSTPVILSPATGANLNDSTPTFSGTADPGATVIVKDGATPICTATVDASGNWSCMPSTPLSEGSHTITATATNATGAESAPATTSINIDTTAPAAPVVTSPLSGAITSTTPTFTGTAEPGTTIAVKDGATTICTATADTSGNWSCTPTTPLSTGPHTISVTATDRAGNVSKPMTMLISVRAGSSATYTVYLPIIQKAP